MKRVSKQLILAGTAALLAGAASAATVPSPMATYESTGTASFNLADGLIIRGTSTATYQRPPLGDRKYTYQATVGHGAVTLSPNVTVSTPAFTTPGVEIPPFCIPFLGCSEGGVTPGVPVPAQSFDLDLPIPVASGATLFDATHTTERMPLGNVMAYDFGSWIFGHPLSFGDLVQDQFETGATTVSKSGSLGSIEGMFTYDGVLSDSRDTITADYELRITAGELLAGLEGFALGLLNDNIGALADQAIDALLAEIGICDFALIGDAICDRLGEDGFVTLTANSIGTLSTSFYISKSVTPSPIPLPFGLPLLASGIGLLGLVNHRRKRMAVA